MTLRQLDLLIIKGAIYRAWHINLYQHGVSSPIPPHIWRRMGAA